MTLTDYVTLTSEQYESAQGPIHLIAYHRNNYVPPNIMTNARLSISLLRLYLDPSKGQSIRRLSLDGQL